MSRRDHCKKVLAQTFKELPETATEKEMRQAVFDAYPFGVRSYSPYKIWLDEAGKWINQWLDDRTPGRKQERQRAKLKKEIEKRGGRVVTLPPTLFDENNQPKF